MRDFSILPPTLRVAILPALVAFLQACGSDPATSHPWLDLAGAAPHEIVEVSGATGGQLVIVVPGGTSEADVMDLAGRIAAQTPPNSTVNARIFDDRDTALNWRTAPADWTVQHLLAVVTHLPGDGAPEVRWMQAAAEEPADGDTSAVPAPGFN